MCAICDDTGCINCTVWEDAENSAIAEEIKQLEQDANLD